MLKYVKGSAELLTFEVVDFGNGDKSVFSFVRISFTNEHFDKKEHVKPVPIIANYMYDEGDSEITPQRHHDNLVALNELMQYSDMLIDSDERFGDDSVEDYYRDTENLIRQKYLDKGGF